MVIDPDFSSPKNMNVKKQKQSANKSMKQGVSPMRPNVKQGGESNGSISTKPATSTTLNSNRKDQPAAKGKDGKVLSPGKDGKNSKQRVHIYHVDDNKHRQHKVNKAVNTINNIIRLIFKNSKDGFALTSSNA